MIFYEHTKNGEKKCHLFFYLKRYYFDKTRNLSFAKKIPNLRQTQWNVYLTHTQSHAIHLDIEPHYHRAFKFFWFFLFIYEIWFAWADITLGNNRESTLRLCYRFRQNNCGLSQSECTLQIQPANYSASQPTNNPTRAHQFSSGGSALHRNACYRMFTCTNKFCIKLYMQNALSVLYYDVCFLRSLSSYLLMFAWFFESFAYTLHLFRGISYISTAHTPNTTLTQPKKPTMQQPYRVMKLHNNSHINTPKALSTKTQHVCLSS